MKSSFAAKSFAPVLLTVLSLFGLAGCGGGNNDGPPPKTVSRVEVTPTAPSIAAGTQQQFTAMVIYSDSSKDDVSATATWTSSDTSIATVSATGLASGKKAGSATITAAFGGASGTATLTVTAASLVSIAVTPTNPSIAKGLTQQFAATGTYTDNSTQDLTATVTWSSSNTAVATISNAAGSQGRAQGAGVGQTTVTATQAGGNISGSTTLTVTSATLVSIAVTPANPSIPKGLSQQFTATGTYTDNSTQNLTQSVTWSSSDGTVATISNAAGSQGLAQGVGTGQSVITAAQAGSGASGTSTLTVTAASLVSIAVTPSSPSIAKGLTQQFTATGTYTDNSTQNLTTSVTWSSSDTTIATISNAAGSQGLAQSVAVGSATITATQPNSSVAPATTTLTVTAATLVSIAVTPAKPSIAKGLTQQFAATGTYTDNSTSDLTTTVTWSSSSTGVATISNASGSQGLAQSVAVGSTTITATPPNSGVTPATATLTVTAATLSRIDVTPTKTTIANGTSQQFSATGVYTDNSKQDFTSTVTWSSSNPNVGQISNSGSTKGLFASTGVGSATVSAADASSGLSGSASITVSAATLSSIQITPSTAKLAQGFSRQYTATGIYSDGSKQDLTTSVTWSSNSSAATISNASGSQGLATASTSGGGTTVVIGAALGSVSSSATLNVTTATLSSITVSPTNPTVPKGLTQAFTANGTFSDSSTQDLTTQVSWTSSNASVATFGTGSNANVATVAASSGSTTVTATANAAPGTNGTTTLTASAATVTSFTISPTNASLPNGKTLQFSANATYTDGSTGNITSAVTWSSSSTGVATISNASGSNGLATAVATGSTTISAAYNGMTQSTPLTVTAAVLTAITVSPTSAQLTAGLQQQFTAKGTYSDKSTADLTASVTWTSSDNSVATISNASGSQGLATTLKQGMVTITATDSGTGINGTATLTVTAATLTSVTVMPNPSTVSTAQTVQLTATANYSDGTKPDVTRQATWSSSNANIATVNPSTGLVTGVAPGSATITATFNGVAGTSALTVQRAALQSITVSAQPDANDSPGSQVPATYALPYTATGNYADGTSADITTSVTWSTLDATIATASNTSGTVGVVTGVAAGNTLVFATLGSITSNNAAVKVTAATLSAIDVSPKNQTTARNATLQFTAKASFSDGSTLNITRYNSVVWASSNSNVATIDANGLATGGTLAGSGLATTTISATKGATSGNTTLK